MECLQAAGSAITYQRAHDARKIVHGRHWQLARYELPVKEIERKLANGRYVVDIQVGETEKLAYVHRWTGKRVEFTRPRLDNKAAALEEAEAKWQCELAFAEANKCEKKASCIVGRIQIPRTNRQIVADWNRKAATNPDWVRYPTKLVTPGAFGRTGNHMESE